jgi:hypothetical protein
MNVERSTTDADIFEHVIGGIRVRLDKSDWDVVEENEGTFTDSTIRVKILGGDQSSVADEVQKPIGKRKR